MQSIQRDILQKVATRLRSSARSSARSSLRSSASFARFRLAQMLAPVAAGLSAIGLGAGCADPTMFADVVYDERFGAATTLDLFLPDRGGPAPPAAQNAVLVNTKSARAQAFLKRASILTAAFDLPCALSACDRP